MPTTWTWHLMQPIVHRILQRSDLTCAPASGKASALRCLQVDISSPQRASFCVLRDDAGTQKSIVPGLRISKVGSRLRRSFSVLNSKLFGSCN